MRVVWTLSMIFVVSACAAASEARAAGDEAAVVLTPQPSPQPRINGAKIFGVRPGHPLLFTIAATGRRPMQFAAEGLPEGLTLDSRTGQISGRTAKRGEHVVTLRAVNELGAAERKLRIVVGDRLALTPHMGWNSWYIWTDSVSDKIIRDAADAMVTSGMINHGYMYVNIDECWHGQARRKEPDLGGPPRDAQGRINPNRRFPDMKALADYIHRRGLKAGIYSSPGPTDCGGHVGSYQHEADGRPAIRRVGLRFPQVRLVLLWDRRGRKGPRPLEEALRVDVERIAEARSRHRAESLPVRDGRRLEVGRLLRQQLADRRRPRLAVGQRVIQKHPSRRLRALRRSPIAQVRRARRLERPRLSAAGLRHRPARPGADAAFAQRAIRLRLALVVGRRPADFQRRHEPAGRLHARTSLQRRSHRRRSGPAGPSGLSRRQAGKAPRFGSGSWRTARRRWDCSTTPTRRRPSRPIGRTSASTASRRFATFGGRKTWGSSRAGFPPPCRGTGWFWCG